MANHPLDGNMIAADAYYGRDASPSEGDLCPSCEEGELVWQEPDHCSCHIHAPCHSHINAPLICLICFEEFEA